MVTVLQMCMEKKIVNHSQILLHFHELVVHDATNYSLCDQFRSNYLIGLKIFYFNSHTKRSLTTQLRIAAVDSTNGKLPLLTKKSAFQCR